MADFNAQNTDAENAKASPKAVSRDNQLKVTQRGSLQTIAREGNKEGEHKVTGEGGTAVTADIVRNVSQ